MHYLASFNSINYIYSTYKMYSYLPLGYPFAYVKEFLALVDTFSANNSPLLLVQNTTKCPS